MNFSCSCPSSHSRWSSISITWLMKPYTSTGLRQEQRQFSYQLSRVCIVVKCAFSRLKGRWRSLLKRIDVCVDFMSTVVTSCCVKCTKMALTKNGLMRWWSVSQSMQMVQIQLSIVLQQLLLETHCALTFTPINWLPCTSTWIHCISYCNNKT